MDIISVIIPIYFGNKYITRLLDILKKNAEICDGKINIRLEVIFINDSPVETILLPKNAALLPYEIKIINNEKNSGIHYSRCTGLKNSSGNLILFLDQDDMIKENYILSQYRNLEDYSVSICNGMEVTDKTEKIIYRSSKAFNLIKNIYSYSLWNEIISPGQCLIRKAAIPEYWMRKILKFNGADDYFLWVLLLADGHRFRLNEKTLYLHMRNLQSTSNDMKLMGYSSREANHYLHTYSQVTKKIAYNNERFVEGYLLKDRFLLSYCDIYLKLFLRKIYKR